MSTVLPQSFPPSSIFQKICLGLSLKTYGSRRRTHIAPHLLYHDQSLTDTSALSQLLSCNTYNNVMGICPNATLRLFFHLLLSSLASFVWYGRYCTRRSPFRGMRSPPQMGLHMPGLDAMILSGIPDMEGQHSCCGFAPSVIRGLSTVVEPWPTRHVYWIWTHMLGA
jgi:hypothetical protein